jgi:hypothetical protein
LIGGIEVVIEGAFYGFVILEERFGFGGFGGGGCGVEGWIGDNFAPLLSLFIFGAITFRFSHGKWWQLCAG